jgi:phage terminase small subunit
MTKNKPISKPKPKPKSKIVNKRKQRFAPRKLRFAEEYCICLNGYEAAKKVGYTDRTAQKSKRLLDDPIVKKYVADFQARLSKKTEITAEKVIQELAKVGFANIQDYIEAGNEINDLMQIEREKAASVESIKTITKFYGTGKNQTKEVSTSLKLHSKISALEQLGRHLGVFEKDNRQKTLKIKVTAKPQQ